MSTCSGPLTGPATAAHSGKPALRWYQREACDAAWRYLCSEPGNPVLSLPTGCHAAGHLILMANGDLRQVQTIVPGEMVMGPDGLPRTVLNLCRGNSQMFLVTPIKGEPFRVNGDHILHLECTREGKKYPSTKLGGEIDHISVFDYIKKAKSWKHLRKLRYADAIEFPYSENKHLLFDSGFEIPPYIVGLMLGDGHMKLSISLTTADQECADSFTDFAKSKGWQVTKQERPGNKASQYVIRTNTTRGRKSPVRALFQRNELLGKVGYAKHIPRRYGISPRWARLELLAGLIDSDGYHDGNGGFTFTNKSERLCRGFAFVARSLGMRAVVRVVRKASQVSEKRIYWQVSISGDTDCIPCRLKRKQAPKRKQIKNALRTGFKVQPCGVENFYGFTLDGDHLYLDGEFLIHHNSGKSLIIAELCRAAIHDYQGRVLVLAHRKELLEQNAGKIVSLVPPDTSVGLYSAGLRRFATDEQIIVAGIQSIHKKAALFGARHLVLIDECHLTPHDGEGMYRTFISDLRSINPQLRMIGLTATPYRTDCGALCRPDGLFQRICYEAQIQQLISEGYLCHVTNKPSETNYDTSKLHIRGGEFIPGEVERLFEAEDKITPSCAEIVAKTAGRKSIIVFCAGVNHAQKVAETLERLTSQTVGVVTGMTTPLERAANLEAFKTGSLRWLCNVDVLTTGFDSPRIDAIAILRATQSPGLFAQICGRGLRVDPSKSDCLLLDFGNNFERHGPIDAIDYGKPKPTSDGTGEAPTKVCPNCQEPVAAGLRECFCGFRFPAPELKHDTKADTSSNVLAAPERWIVQEIDWHRHTKKGVEPGSAPDTLCVVYTCTPFDELTEMACQSCGKMCGKDKLQPCDSSQLPHKFQLLCDCGRVVKFVQKSGNLSKPEKIKDYVCIEHNNYARTKAYEWWKKRSIAPFPDSIDEGMQLLRRGAVAMPTELTTIREGKYYKITHHLLDPIPTEWHEETEEEYDPFGDAQFEEFPKYDETF